jgi:hypothetical protein
MSKTQHATYNEAKMLIEGKYFSFEGYAIRSITRHLKMYYTEIKFAKSIFEPQYITSSL